MGRAVSRIGREWALAASLRAVERFEEAQSGVNWGAVGDAINPRRVNPTAFGRALEGVPLPWIIDHDLDADALLNDPQSAPNG